MAVTLSCPQCIIHLVVYHFQARPVVWCGHVNEFWPKWCNQMCCVADSKPSLEVSCSTLFVPSSPFPVVWNTDVTTGIPSWNMRTWATFGGEQDQKAIEAWVLENFVEKNRHPRPALPASSFTWEANKIPSCLSSYSFQSLCRSPSEI